MTAPIRGKGSSRDARARSGDRSSPDRHRARLPFRSLTPLFALAGLLLATSGEGIPAQEPVPNERLSPTAELLRKPTAIEPLWGPPGTPVEVRGEHLPALTPVNLAFGGTGSGFEGLAFLLTDERGRLEATVEVPGWAARDQLHRFIIFDAYFSPLSMTQLFHVTGPDGSIVRRGEVIEAGDRCTVLAGPDERERYVLVDPGRELGEGERVEVEGVVIDSSECGSDTHLSVAALRTPGR